MQHTEAVMHRHQLGRIKYSCSRLICNSWVMNREGEGGFRQDVDRFKIVALDFFGLFYKPGASL